MSLKQKRLKINLSRQIEGNCIIAGVDAAFKTALYHCHTDIFQTIDTRKEKLTPKIQCKRECYISDASTLPPCLKRAMITMKIKKLDRIFSYYEERKKNEKETLKA